MKTLFYTKNKIIMEKITDEQLWDLADGFLSNAQKIEIEQKINQNSDILARFENIQAQKRLFSMTEMEKPTSDFAAKLLQKWQTEQASVALETAIPTANHTILKIVFGAFSLLSIALLYLVFSNQGVSEKIEIDFSTITIPWKTLSLTLTIISAVVTVAFIEKLIVTRYHQSFMAHS